jgi:cell division protein FtsL
LQSKILAKKKPLINKILIIVVSVSIFGILVFSFVRRALKKKIDQLVEEEKAKEKDNKDL